MVSKMGDTDVANPKLKYLWEATDDGGHELILSLLDSQHKYACMYSWAATIRLFHLERVASLTFFHIYSIIFFIVKSIAFCTAAVICICKKFSGV